MNIAATTVYAFSGAAGQLSVGVGTPLTLTARVGVWFTGRLQSGETGLIPASYVKYQGPSQQGKAKFPFTPTGDGQIALSGGDIVKVYSSAGDWCEIEFGDKLGIVPKSFLEISDQAVRKFRALYTRVAPDSTQLPFAAGDTIVLVADVDKDWFRGSCGTNEGKLVPWNHVTEISAVASTSPPIAAPVTQPSAVAQQTAPGGSSTGATPAASAPPPPPPMPPAPKRQIAVAVAKPTAETEAPRLRHVEATPNTVTSPPQAPPSESAAASTSLPVTTSERRPADNAKDSSNLAPDPSPQASAANKSEVVPPAKAASNELPTTSANTTVPSAVSETHARSSPRENTNAFDEASKSPAKARQPELQLNRNISSAPANVEVQHTGVDNMPEPSAKGGETNDDTSVATSSVALSSVSAGRNATLPLKVPADSPAVNVMVHPDRQLREDEYLKSPGAEQSSQYKVRLDRLLMGAEDGWSHAVREREALKLSIAKNEATREKDRAEIGRLTTAEETIRKRMLMMEEDVTTLRRELDAKKAELLQVRTLADETMRDNRAHLNSVETENATLRSKLEQMADSALQLETRHQSEIDKLVSENAQLHSQLEALRGSAAATQTSSQAEMNLATSNNNNLRTQVAEQEQEIARLRDCLSVADVMNQNAEATKLRLSEELRVIKLDADTEIQQLQTSNDELVVRVNTLARELSDMRGSDETDSLKHRCTQLEEQLRQAEHAQTVLNASKDILAHSCAELSQHVTRLNAELEDAHNAKRELDERNAILVDASQSRIAHDRAVADDNERCKQEIVNLRDLLSKATTQLVGARRDLLSSQTIMRSLQPMRAANVSTAHDPAHCAPCNGCSDALFAAHDISSRQALEIAALRAVVRRKDEVLHKHLLQSLPRPSG